VSPPPITWALHPQLGADTHPVAMLALCELRLLDDANYPWLVLVPRIVDARELIDLDGQQQAGLMREIDRTARVVRDLFRPHKLNIASLGNLVPQLHVHVIGREVDDPAWPAPVWGRVQARPYEPDALVDRVRRLHAAFAG
jgi:diadenosine tetraphosphate (Ap4A) HIT family hydrolase